MNAIMDQLNTLADEAERITDGTLNWGGCCVFAGMVALQLRSLGIPAWCAVSGYRGDVSIPFARKELKENNLDPAMPRNWNHVGINFSHVGVVFKMDGHLWLYDTEDGIRRMDRHATLLGREIIKGRLTAKEAALLGSTPEGWNSVFTRYKIPALQKAVNKTLTGITP